MRDAEESGGVSDHIILEDYPARPTPDYIKYREEDLSALPAYRDAVGDGEEEQEEQIKGLEQR